jgi:stage V sporulation protein SpoVS
VPLFDDNDLLSVRVESNGHDVPGTVIGVLKNEHGVEILPAVAAGKIDDKQMKFVELQTEELRCSRDGIITAGGGL